MNLLPPRANWNFWAWLASTSGLGAKTLRSAREILAQCRVDAETLFAAPPSERLRGQSDLPSWLREALLKIPGLTRARRTQFENLLRARKIRPVLEDDGDFPWRLVPSLEEDSPFCLYYCGDLARLRDRLAIALVGTRHPSPEGMIAARRYAAALSEAGVEIVSGYARGIDTAAHTGALHAGKDTTLVLAEGLGQFTPRKDLASYRGSSGLLAISEFPLTAGWRSGFAVRRNRTIVALSDGVIVVETGLRGGTAYAVRAAKEFKRPLFAPQYKRPGPHGSGNASLLASGARALEPDPPNMGKVVGEIIEALNTSRDRLLAKSSVAKAKRGAEQLDFTKRETTR